MNDTIKPMSIPNESEALSAELVDYFADTSIPQYVLKYGNSFIATSSNRRTDPLLSAACYS